jgi:hypothetical protein
MINTIIEYIKHIPFDAYSMGQKSLHQNSKYWGVQISDSAWKCHECSEFMNTLNTSFVVMLYFGKYAYHIVEIRVAEVWFSPVQQGIFPNREPEPNGRGTTGKTENRTCRTTRFRFELGSD